MKRFSLVFLCQILNVKTLKEEADIQCKHLNYLVSRYE